MDFGGRETVSPPCKKAQCELRFLGMRKLPLDLKPNIPRKLCCGAGFLSAERTTETAVLLFPSTDFFFFI